MTPDVMEAHLNRYDASMKRRLARPGTRCRARCHGTPCEFPEGHTGNHVTTEGGGYGIWTPEQCDPPTFWDKLLTCEIGP